MRLALLVFILILALSQTACNAVSEESPAAESFDEAEHAARMVEVTQTLIDSPDPEEQAAGLLLAELSTSWRWLDHAPILSEAESVELLYTMIERSDSALGRALTARVCAMKDLQAECRRRGLDEAIVRLDGAELFARTDLTGIDDLKRTREVLVAAEGLAERHMELALLLLDAMEAHGGFQPLELSITPLSVFLSTTPSLASISRLCVEQAMDGSELDQACERLLDSMVNEAASFILNMLGASVMAQRAEAHGDQEAMDRYEQWRAGFYEWMGCASVVRQEFWESADTTFMREFFRYWQRHGEARAYALVAERAGLDCELPEPSPFSRAAER